MSVSAPDILATPHSPKGDHPVTTINMRVFHTNNFRDAHFDPPGTHPVTEVFRYTVDPTEFPHSGVDVSGFDATTDDQLDVYLLDHAFMLFNVGDDPMFVDPPDQRALDYRAPKNRSLSIGDVVAIHDRFYQCSARSGWVLLDERPVVKPDEHEPTSTPYVPAEDEPDPDAGLTADQEGIA